LGGSLDLSSLPGEGTRLEVNLPVNPEPDMLLS
jgi:signal transduction histidine kinase